MLDWLAVIVDVVGLTIISDDGTVITVFQYIESPVATHYMLYSVGTEVTGKTWRQGVAEKPRPENQGT